MKILKVNKDLCIKCGACVAIASDYFEFDDDGFATPIKDRVEENVDIRTAIEACPTNAISLTSEN